MKEKRTGVATVISLWLGIWLASCQKPSAPPPADAGTAASAAVLPGPAGPFVEIADERVPERLYCVLAGDAADLPQAAAVAAKARASGALAAGWPGIDQARAFGQDGDGFVVVAGKFARREFAEALAGALRRADLAPRVVERPYRHDRFTPATNDLDGPAAGRVLSGMSQTPVPLLTRPERDSAAAGEAADGMFLKVTARAASEGEPFFRVETPEGDRFLPAARLLIEYNAFPAPKGTRALLGVPRGCRGDGCRYDYWLLDGDFEKRRLLASDQAALAHAFTRDDRLFAAAFSDGRLILIDREQTRELGPGAAPDYAPQAIFDLPGEPAYSRKVNRLALPIIPHGRNLIAKFYRRQSFDGGTRLDLVTVLISSEGKLLDRRSEPMDR
jgi:hypothetical protein